MTKAYHSALSVPWAMQEPELRMLLQIARRENRPLEALQAERGEPLDNTRVVSIRGGVATIPIEGPIFRKANLFSAISGAVSLQMLALDLNAALENPDVAAILLDVNSPGGEVTGVHEFAGMVYAARDQKPITAYISGTGASAAYWIAAACREVILNPTSIVGSIGVRMSVSKPDDEEVEFVSSGSPNKNPDPTTDAGKVEYQNLVDRIQDVFVADVARFRGVSTETVLSDFGQGGVKVGEDAVTAKMADRLGTYESTLRALSVGVDLPPVLFAGHSHTPAHAGEDTKPMSWIKELMGRMSGEEKQEIAAQLNEGGSTPPPAVPPTASNADIEALKAQVAAEQGKNAKMRADLLEKDAQAFAAENASHFLPAEAEHIISGYLRAAQDDEALPVAEGQPTRLEAFMAGVKARPEHNLTTELLTSDLSKLHVLPSAVSGQAESVEAAQESAREYAAKANGNGSRKGN